MAQIQPPMDDHQTDRAVDDIVAHEGDEVLEAEDKERAAINSPPEKTGFMHRFRQFWHDWWSDPRKRWGTIIGIVVLILILGILPPTRYFALNSVGVRAGLSVEVLDKSTLQPLKNVNVTVHDVTIKTDKNGRANFKDLRLGRTELVIDRYAFAPVKQPVTVGWGSNPLGEYKLDPTGAQYVFRLTDYLSGKPIAKVEATSGKASAFSDKDGKLVLTIDEPSEELDITIAGTGYRTEKIKLSAETKDEQSLSLAPAKLHAFISKRSGTLDLYKIYADGKDEQMVLKGTGSERDDIAVIPHSTDNVVAMVSSRGNQRNSDGFLLSTLTLVNLSNNKAEEVATSERVLLIGWSNNRIIYVRVASGASGNSAQRHRLISYDYKTKDVKELAAGNSFNDVMLAADKIYYAPSGAYQDGASVGLFKVDADGNNRQTVLPQEAWNLFRTDYGTIDIAVAGGDWYEYKLGDTRSKKLDGEPGNVKSRVYVNGPNDQRSLWVDQRDGKGVLLVYDIKAATDKKLFEDSGLTNPISWISDKAVVYRKTTDQETADYALSLEGGQPKKIRDVTSTSGLDQWYYY